MSDKNEQSGIGRFYGVGAGPGDPGLLTVRAVEVLRSVDVVFHVAGVNTKKSVSGSVVDSIEDCTAERIELVFSMKKDIADRKTARTKNARRIADELENGRDCAFVTVGDPLIYSTYPCMVRGVRELLGEIHVETIPGITSFQAAAAHTNLPLVENGEVLTIIPAWTEESARHPAMESADTIVLLKMYRHREKILKSLEEQGITSNILYASRVGLEGEIITDNFREIADCPEEYLSMMVVKRNNCGAGSGVTE